MTQIEGNPRSLSTSTKQNAHAGEAIGVCDQPDDFDQYLSLDTAGEALGEFLNVAGPIPDGFPGKPHDP